VPRHASITIQFVAERLRTWLQEQTDASMARAAETVPLRKDMVTLLTFVRDNKVVGTQATGNMPLKDVREVTAHFVNPPKLEETIGNHTYQVRSETDVWVLYFLHILADVAGLLQGERVRRWRITPQGERFLDVEPRLQVAFLLAVWWYRVNWIVAYPYEGIGHGLPPLFSQSALAGLRQRAAGTSVPFDEFADWLIARARLRWGVEDKRIATVALRGAIRAMVIDRLAEFGVLERKYRKEPVGNLMLPRLVEFKITLWGTSLLDALSVI
jgi:hypothetical protein